jgi:hypothetical protein
MGKRKNKCGKPRITLVFDNQQDLLDLNCLAAQLDTNTVNACKYAVYFLLQLLREKGMAERAVAAEKARTGETSDETKLIESVPLIAGPEETGAWLDALGDNCGGMTGV